MGVNRKKLRVLVVDDEELTLNVVCSMLKHLGHDTIAARNATEALACLSTEEYPNFLLTDINMPDMDGWELAHRVKAIHPWMPIVAITGQDPGSVVPRLNVSGISHALFKPFNMGCLRDALAATPKTERVT